MNICFLYPGQGAQYPGMGRDFYEKSASVRQLFSIATKACGIDTAELLFESEASVLKETRNTQIAVTLMDLSVRAYLREHGIVSSGCGGFSLGEWSAYVDAGVLLPEEVFPIVMKRSALMSESSDRLNSPSENGLGSGTGSGMAAVIGLAPEKVEGAIAEIEGVFPVNYNSREQTVISGLADAVELAGRACKKAGARRVIPLKVSGPFHTPLLKDAEEAFDAFLAEWELRPPQKELFSNVTGTLVKNVSEVRLNAVKQIDSPVRWTSEEDAIASRGYEICVECGPGKVLSGLWKRTDSEIPCVPTDTLEAVDVLIEQLHRNREKDKQE